MYPLLARPPWNPLMDPLWEPLFPGRTLQRWSCKMCLLWFLPAGDFSSTLSYFVLVFSYVHYFLTRSAHKDTTKLLSRCLWLSLSKRAKQQTFCFSINVFYLFGELHISSSPLPWRFKPYRDSSGIQPAYGEDWRNTQEAARLWTSDPQMYGGILSSNRLCRCGSSTDTFGGAREAFCTEFL